MHRELDAWPPTSHPPEPEKIAPIRIENTISTVIEIFLLSTTKILSMIVDGYGNESESRKVK